MSDAAAASCRREVSLFGGRLHGLLFRISFSGELAYRTRRAPPAMAKASPMLLMQNRRSRTASAPFMASRGAQKLSRIEKGLRHPCRDRRYGHPRPISVTGKMVSSLKKDFISKAMLAPLGPIRS